MMSYWKNVVVVWGRVFKEKKYVVLSLVVAFLFYMMNGLILNLNNIRTFYEIMDFFGTVNILFFLSLKFYENVMGWGLFWTLVLSFLVGMMVSLLAYRTRLVGGGKKAGFLGGVGVFLGMAAPGCAACGIGLLSLIGFSSVLVALPFGGHEIIVLAVGLVFFSVVKISGKLYNPICSVKLDVNQNERARGSRSFSKFSKRKSTERGYEKK